jgi:hypothetical protein
MNKIYVTFEDFMKFVESQGRVNKLIRDTLYSVAKALKRAEDSEKELKDELEKLKK